MKNLLTIFIAFSFCLLFTTNVANAKYDSSKTIRARHGHNSVKVVKVAASQSEQTASTNITETSKDTNNNSIVGVAAAAKINNTKTKEEKQLLKANYIQLRDKK